MMTKFGSVLIQLVSVDSTNNYVANLIENESCQDGSVIMADYQTQGRGQWGNSWQSVSAENLMCSIAFQPNYPLQEQIRLSWYSALMWQQCLRRFGVHALIKWPNDLYVDGKKIGGLLIEQQLKGAKLEWVVLGCGINVNHNPGLAMSTSILDETGQRFQPTTVLTEFLDLMNAQQAMLIGNFQDLKTMFEAELWLKGEWRQFATKEGRVFDGAILGVSDIGEVRIQTSEGIQHFGNQEVSYLLNS